MELYWIAFRLISSGVTLDKARALYLVRVSELHVKSMYKIDWWGKGGGQKIVY